MHAVTVSPCCISRRPCSLHTSKMRADVCYDLNYADVVLQASDGVEFPTSRGLCGGSCSTLKTLFEVKSDQKVYLISEVSSHTLFPLLKWLHGPRSGLNLELTHEQALPMLRAADYLGMQCWIDNCACHMKLESDWLTWVELANEFSSTDLLLAVLQHIPARLQLSGPDICCKLHSIKLMQVALQFFDQVCVVLLFMGRHSNCTGQLPVKLMLVSFPAGFSHRCGKVLFGHKGVGTHTQ